MKLLAIDTATERMAVGVRCGDALHEADTVTPGGHADELPTRVRALLAQTGLSPDHLDAIVLGTGPGGFAGLRIGMGYAKAMAWALNKPVVAVGTLEAMALQILDAHLDIDTVWVVSDARMAAVYAAAFVRDPAQGCRAIIEPVEVAAAELNAWLGERAQAAGNGIIGSALALDVCREVRSARWAVCEADPGPTGFGLLRLGALRWQAGLAVPPAKVVPQYVRERVALTQAERDAGERLGVLPSSSL